jgi:antitoxin VapB
MVATAKVFTTGNSQAVRLPKAFRVDATEMWISRNPRTGEITLKPKPDASALEAFLQELRSLPPSEEFLPPRDDASRDDPLAGWTE